MYACINEWMNGCMFVLNVCCVVLCCVVLGGGYDIVLLKFASSGELVFSRQIGTPYKDVASGVVFSARDSSVYVTGFSGGDLSLFNTTSASSDSSSSSSSSSKTDVVLVKFSTDGALLFISQAGSPEYDSGNGVAIADPCIVGGGRWDLLCLSEERKRNDTTTTAAAAADASSVYVIGSTSGSVSGQSSFGECWM